MPMISLLQYRLASALAILVTGSAAVVLAPAALQAQEPIRIGVPMILSGAGAQFGTPVLKGAQMYADEINAKGGVLGRKFEIISRDTKARPDEAVRVSRELVVRERVDFLLGTFTSAEGTAVSAIAKDLKVLFMAPVPATDRLTAPDSLHPYVFRGAKNTTTEGRAAAEIMAKWQVKRVGTIAPDYAYGQDAVSSFVAHLKKMRPDVQIVDQQWPKLNEPDYSAFVTAQTATKPEAVLSVICCGNFDAFAKQAKPLGYFDALKHHSSAWVRPARSRPLVRSATIIRSASGTTSYDALFWDAGPRTRSYLDRLKKYLNDPQPSTWPIQGYIAMQFLTEAIRKSGGLDELTRSRRRSRADLDHAHGPMTMREKDHQCNAASSTASGEGRRISLPDPRSGRCISTPRSSWTERTDNEMLLIPAAMLPWT